MSDVQANTYYILKTPQTVKMGHEVKVQWIGSDGVLYECDGLTMVPISQNPTSKEDAPKRIYALQPCGPFVGVEGYVETPDHVESLIRHKWGNEVQEIEHEGHKWRVHVVNPAIDRDFWYSYDLWPVRIFRPEAE